MLPHVKKVIMAAGLVATLATVSPAFASPREDASAAIVRAEAKLDLVSRSASQPGMTGDQSQSQARQRIEQARAAAKSGRHETAQMLADEAGLLAELTGERAKLAALLANLQAANSNLNTLQKIGQM